MRHVKRSLNRAAVLSAGGTAVEKVSTALAYVIVGTIFWLCKVDCHLCGDTSCTEDHS